MYGKVDIYRDARKGLYFIINNKDIGEKIANWLLKLEYSASVTGRTYWDLKHGQRQHYIRINLDNKIFRYSACVPNSIIKKILPLDPVPSSFTEEQFLTELVAAKLEN